MLWHFAVLGLLLLAPAVASAQDLATLLAFIEEHNHRLQAQRHVLATLTAAPTDTAEVRTLLEADQRSVWKAVRLSAGLSERVSPGQEGSGLDARIGVGLSLPFADCSITSSIRCGTEWSGRSRGRTHASGSCCGSSTFSSATTR